MCKIVVVGVFVISCWEFALATTDTSGYIKPTIIVPRGLGCSDSQLTHDMTLFGIQVVLPVATLGLAPMVRTNIQAM